MRTRATEILTAALLALVGCSNGDTGTDGSAAKGSAPARPKDASAAPPSPTKGSSPLTIGQPHKWNGVALDEKTPTNGTTTVLTYAHDVDVDGWPSEALGVDNPLWVAIDVKVCNDKGGVISVSQGPWSLGFSDSRVEPSFLDGNGLPKPEYPLDGAMVKPGDCIRGKIPFVLERGQRPDRVIYETFGAPQPVEWTVPKSSR
ncbi:hypothetical protein ACIQMR_10440 [Streptomyces sp. NPDC091376]|uniref:hypothetical protein n=1 Tax=Streptomyces sp. NPDC091376 TaxID=3365994 RepID=UPI0038203CA1